MHYWDLRRMLRDIERADDRWRLHEAWLAPAVGDWTAVVDDADTGLWHTLDAYTDLATVLATLPPPYPAGALLWGELLALCDQISGAGRSWRLARLVRADSAETAWERYGIFVLGERGGRWIDRPADWARLRDWAEGPPGC